MKILIFSVAPWVPTGYGLTCRELTRGLAASGHQVDIAAYFGISGMATEWEGHKVTPVNGAFSLDMTDFLANIAKGYDLILQHFDTWLLPRGWAKKMPCPVVVYGPVDCEQLPSMQKESVEGAHVVAMSPHGQLAYMNEGIEAHYIPHFVDTSIFKPYIKADCKEALGIPAETFIVGIVGTNRGQRKNIAGMMKAFAQADLPNAKLYLHTYMERDHLNCDGINLLKLGANLGLSGRILTTAPSRYIEGLTDPEMCLIYNCFNIHMECSCGEGFAIPIIQAGACGVASIVQDFSALPYTAGLGSILVPKGNAYYQDMLEEWHFVASTQHMVEALHIAQRDWEQLGIAAWNNAQQYQMPRVIQMWADYVKELTCLV